MNEAIGVRDRGRIAMALLVVAMALLLSTISCGAAFPVAALRCAARRPFSIRMAIKDIEWQKVDAELEKAANTVRNTRWVGGLTVGQEGIDEFTEVLVKTKDHLASTKETIECRFAEAEAAATEAKERAAEAEAAAAEAKRKEQKVLQESKAEAERAIAARDSALSKAHVAVRAAAAAKAEAAAAAAARDAKAAAGQEALEEAARAERARDEALARVQSAEGKAARAAKGEAYGRVRAA